MGFFDAETSGRTGRLPHILIALIAFALCSLPVAALADGDDPTTEPAIEATAPDSSADATAPEATAPDSSDDAAAPVAEDASREEEDVVAGAIDAGDPADETDPVDGSDPADDEVVEDLSGTETYGSGVAKLRLAAGTKDHGRAQAVVDALNASAAAYGATIALDGSLRDAAMQRAAETSLWLSAKRPSGAASLAPGAVEYRFDGAGLEPSSVASRLASYALNLSDYHSVGVGCWEQGGERFYVVLLSAGDALRPADAVRGTEAWSPEVAVDLSGSTSRVLLGRLQASGYRTNLSMVPDSTRAVSFSWVTAPEEAQLPQARDLPIIAIDPSSFRWSSSSDSVASVSPTGVVTMHATSILTPDQSLERGADITAGLDGSDRTLSFHVSAAVPVYRLYNPSTGEHLYTTDMNEYNSLPGFGWNQEKVVWQSVWSSPVEGEITGTPIYRLYNPFNGDHHYTADLNEYNSLPANGWTQEKVAYYSADGPWDPALGGQPVYRLYNSYQTANGGLGSHLWTTDANEYAKNGELGWTQEGASLYGVR